MTLATLQSLYLHELQDLHSAETQLVKALPKMAKAAHAPELKSAFTTHLAQTKEHVRRLEQLLLGLGEEPGGDKCKGMAGLIKEGTALTKEGGDPAVLDNGLITAAQKVEHYEIAGYGSARTLAQKLGDDSAADVLQLSLNEESQTDASLTALAATLLTQAAQAQPSVDNGSSRNGQTRDAENDAALREHDASMDGEDVDTNRGAIEEEAKPINTTDEASGPGARWETNGQRQSDPVTGD